MLQYYLHQLGAARKGLGRDLQSWMSMKQMLMQDWWPWQKTCSLGFNLHQLLMQIFFLQGKTCTLGCLRVRCWYKTRACALRFHWVRRKCKILPLNHVLIQLNPRAQVFPCKKRICISIWCKLNPRLQVFGHGHQFCVSIWFIDIRDCKSLPNPLPCSTQLLQVVLWHPIY